MPTINKLPKRYQPKTNKTALIYSKIYNTRRWRDLRAWWLIHHPLCQRCLALGVVREATEVHHVTPISTGTTLEQMLSLGFDAMNLESLCSECHIKTHRKN